MDLLHSRSHFGFIGLGLIGGSVARCIRRELPDARISAYNYYETKKHPRLEKALADGVLTDITTDISRVSDWDVIFLCAPVRTNVAYLTRLKPYLKADCILTDVGSVKGEIYHAIRNVGLDHCFIGGHPMAGTEHIGYEYSFAELLRDCYYILTPTDRIPEESIAWMQEFVRSVTHSRCVTIDVNEHDEATAGISHAPHVISAALVNAVRARDDKGSTGFLPQAASGTLQGSLPPLLRCGKASVLPTGMPFSNFCRSTGIFSVPWSRRSAKAKRKISSIFLPLQRNTAISSFRMTVSKHLNQTTTVRYT